MAYETKIAADRSAPLSGAATHMFGGQAGRAVASYSVSHITVECDSTLMRYILNRLLVAYVRDDMSNHISWMEFPALGGDGEAEGEPKSDLAIWCGRKEDCPSHMLDRPPVWLASVPYMPYIGRRARGRMPKPETLTDLDAAVLLQCAAYDRWPAVSAWNMIVRSRRQGVVRVQSPDLLHELVLGGAGVALLPAIAHKSNYNLVPLPEPFGQFFPVDVWLAVSDQRRHEISVKRLAALIADHFATKQNGVLSR